jgi:hypothetical protein
MDEENKEDKTKVLKKLMKLRKTKNIIIKRNKTNNDRQIIG